MVIMFMGNFGVDRSFKTIYTILHVHTAAVAVCKMGSVLENLKIPVFSAVVIIMYKVFIHQEVSLLLYIDCWEGSS